MPYVKGSRLRGARTLNEGNKRIIWTHAHFSFQIQETKSPTTGPTINECSSTIGIKVDATWFIRHCSCNAWRKGYRFWSKQCRWSGRQHRKPDYTIKTIQALSHNWKGMYAWPCLLKQGANHPYQTKHHSCTFYETSPKSHCVTATRTAKVPCKQPKPRYNPKMCRTIRREQVDQRPTTRRQPLMHL